MQFGGTLATNMLLASNRKIFQGVSWLLNSHVYSQSWVIGYKFEVFHFPLDVQHDYVVDVFHLFFI